MAWRLLLGNPVISLPVLNECRHVLIRNRGWSADEVAQALENGCGVS